MTEFHQPPYPEFGTKPEDFADLHELMSGLRALNYALLPDNVRNPSETGQSSTEDEPIVGLNLPEQQAMARSILEITHADTLHAAGLALSPVRRLSQGMGEAVYIGISDGNAFCHLMEKAAALDYPHGFDAHIEQIAMQTMTEVYYDIDGEAYDVFAATVEPYSSEIAAWLSQVPGVEPVCLEGWQIAAVQAKTRSFKEWVKADQASLLEDVDTQQDINDGPAVWHRTHRPEELMDRWIQTIKLLNQLSLNPNAANFYQELLSRVQTAFNFSRQDFLSTDRPDKQVYYNALQSVEGMLTMLSEPR